MRVPQLWTMRQRGVVLLFVMGLIAYLSFQYFHQPINVSDPQPSAGVRAGELANRIDPNSADAPLLAAIPMLGEKRAAEIVAYRDEFTRSHPGKVPFKKPNDLLLLKNFGPATVSSVQPYLIFPSSASTTKSFNTEDTESSEPTERKKN